MSYQYIKSQCLARSIGAQWSFPDVKNARLCDIYFQYSRVYLVLFNTALERECIVDMNSVRAVNRTSTMTVAEWLVEIGETALDEVATLPDSTIRFAKYANVLQCGYKVKLVDRTAVDEQHRDFDTLNDAMLGRDGIYADEGLFPLIHTHCLTTVSGFIHNTDTDGTRAFIVDAGKVMRKAGQSHIGLLSFNAIGAIQKVNIPAANISRLDQDTSMFKKLTFTTDISLENKSVMLVLGGYLYLPRAGVFWQNSDSSFILSLENANYIERYLESKDHLDMSGLGLLPMDNSPDAVSTLALTSDETIKKYFQLSQSFLVVVDTPSLTSRKMALRGSNVPGAYTTVLDPVSPVITGYGRMPAYWKKREGDVWKLTINDNYLRNFVSRQRELKNVSVISDYLNSTRPTDISNGYLLEISTAA